MLSDYYQAWLDDLLIRHPEVEAAVVVGTDGKSLGHANMGVVEETLISGLAFALFGTSDSLVSDTGHGFVRYVRLRFKAGILNILPLAPGILLVVVFGKEYPVKYIFSPERVFD